MNNMRINVFSYLVALLLVSPSVTSFAYTSSRTVTRRSKAVPRGIQEQHHRSYATGPTTIASINPFGDHSSVKKILISLQRLRLNHVLAASSSSQIDNSSTSESNISIENLSSKRILVVGGSGRVGGSVVCQLTKHNAIVMVGGTKLESFQQSQARWKQLFPTYADNFDSIPFYSINREDATSIADILLEADKSQQKIDLVVHTAGPFQGKVNSPNGVIQACVENGVAYIDVCDDYCTASAAKAKYTQTALDANVPCIVSTGCWPGVSSLMAKQLTQSVLEKRPNLTAKDLTVDFNFFTAGSGGAGATLLVATFLILSEESLMIVDGRRKEVPAMKEYSKIDFGEIVGDKDVAHLNLLEAASCHDVLGIGNVKTLFGTAPNFWNTLLGLMAQLPSSFLSNEPLMEKLAIFSLPIVRVVDYFAGATNAMRVDVSCEKDASVKEMALYAHENLEPCVGECVSAFCSALLSGSVRPGIWFPEEAIVGKEDIAAVLGLSGVGAHTLKVESDDGLQNDDVWGRRGNAKNALVR